ncbi:MAG: sulfur carrier protein ThiS [Armatimonadetes bacterium]|nr:sulfur carrier protein ThiS [Akkermansiaceae bacterium]
MQILLNGKPHPIGTSLSLSELLESLHLTGKPIVAELNQEAILTRLFDSTLIKENDRLEIITLAAGG